MADTMNVSSIKTGRRHRADMGDIGALAKSIADIGLLHPVVVTPDGRLIAGERRLRAFKHLGREEIPVTVIDLNKIVLGEYAENIFRKAFTPSEMVEIADDIEPLQMLAAKKRQLAGKGEDGSGGRGKKNLRGIFPEVSGRAMDKVAKVVGKDRRTLEKARAIVQAAKAEPEKFGALKEDMDASGKVDRAYKELQIKKQRADYEARAERGGTVADLVALAESGARFGVIYADPPWDYKTYSASGLIGTSPQNHYKTMSLDEIKAVPVAPLAADDCVLLLWATMPKLPEAFEVATAWGFEFKTIAFVWVKQNKSGEGLHWGNGYWTRSNSELCLLATKGSPHRMAEDVHQVVMAPVGEHSTKPDEVRRRIERLLNGPYLELFARKTVTGWQVWGNEAPTREAAE